MKGIRAKRIKIRIGNVWTSPTLHILLTKEDEVIVARCLDFTVSSHGHDEKEALVSLADCIKEYVITAIETQSTDTIVDPAHGKYWRMYYELESKKSLSRLKSSLRKPSGPISYEDMEDMKTIVPEINYA